MIKKRRRKNDDNVVKVTIYLAPWVKELLRRQSNQSEFTEKALIKFGRWKKPQ